MASRRRVADWANSLGFDVRPNYIPNALLLRWNKEHPEDTIRIRSMTSDTDYIRDFRKYGSRGGRAAQISLRR